MSTKRRSISPELKLKVVLEVVRGHQTLNQIASKYQISPTLITRWKKHLLETGASIFEDSRCKKIRDDKDEKIEQLYNELGRTQHDLNWLKKKHGIID